MSRGAEPVPRGTRQRVGWAVRGVLAQVGAVSALLTAGWCALVAVGAPAPALVPQLVAWSLATSTSSAPVLALLNAGRPQGRPVLRLVITGTLSAVAIGTSAVPSLFPVIVAGTALITLPRSPGVRTELGAAAVTVGGTVALLVGVDRGAVPSMLPRGAGIVVAVSLCTAALVFLRYAGALAQELSVRTAALEAEQARRIDELHHASTHDVLTGLLNRAGMTDALTEALAGAGPARGAGVVFLDLDGFKPVNDTHGHAAGDLLLRTLAERLRAAMRPQDRVARVGGDEFVVLVQGLTDPAGLEAITGRTLEAIGRPVDLGGATVVVGASAGTAWTEDPATPMPDLLGRADRAMYAVKAGRPHPVRATG